MRDKFCSSPERPSVRQRTHGNRHRFRALPWRLVQGESKYPEQCALSHRLLPSTESGYGRGCDDDSRQRGRSLHSPEKKYRLEEAVLLTVGRRVVAFREKQHWRAALIFLKAGRPGTTVRRHQMSLGTILLIVVVLMLIGAIPSWPHSRGWGYGPSGGLGLVLLILIVLLLMGRL